MIDDGDGRELVIRYVHDDEKLRREFDNRLARYLRGQPGHARWDITPLVVALDQLGHQIPSMLVRLRRLPGKAELEACIELELAPIPPERGPAPDP
ncbi:hypothetical protein [Microbispora sp. NBRC 16548]|uniref:hypothetical protein n=1 Tax=Microbispora sp. NBRC 16548 TaxID=3030994 RepID=UPI0024A42D71|nr:hypothetical protein [Microbispora sp. NBRC 16548]GLX11373.1 hypothetical protein Misp03_82990 [Microbispora sp. NBRC 16548]